MMERGLNLEFRDVDQKSELPSAPPGRRYLDFLGGTRTLRCFVVPAALPRAEFLIRHGDLLDEIHQPILEYGEVMVRADASYSVPGFYVVSLRRQYAALDLVPDDISRDMFETIRRVRTAMRAALGVEHTHVHYEEKPDPSCNVHWWLLPIWPGPDGATPPILRLDLRAYLTSFDFQQVRPRILELNAAMRVALTSRPRAALRPAPLCLGDIR